MNRHIKYILSVVLAIILTIPAVSQDRRTLETKVADILAQFPTPNAERTNRLMNEMTELGPEGLSKFFNLIVPAGTGDDTQVRYALSSLARYAGATGREEARKLAESSFLAALNRASDQEVKAFFIRELAFCGQSSTVTALVQYLATSDLSSPAVATLTTIGTEEAASAIFDGLKNQSGEAQIEFIKALGTLKYKPAEAYLITLSSNTSPKVLKQVYAALAEIGSSNSMKLFKSAAEKAAWKTDESEIMVSYFHYAWQLTQNGEVKLSNSLASNALKNCTKKDQLHFRSSALEILHANQGEASASLLLKEIKNPDKAYRNAVLRIAGTNLTSKESDQWVNAFKKAPAETQAELLFFLAPRQEENILSDVILPSLGSSDAVVRQEAIRALVVNQKKTAVPVLLDQLKKTQSQDDYPVLEEALLTACSIEECDQLAAEMNELNDAGKTVLIHVLADRHASSYFGLIEKLCASENAKVRQAAYVALSSTSQTKDIDNLIALLGKTEAANETEAAQKAIIKLYQTKDHPESSVILNELRSGSQKEKLIPVLPYLNDRNALKSVISLLENGTAAEKEAAFKALTNWNGNSALPALYDIFTDNNSFRASALTAYLKQVGQAGIPDDQKLLWLDKIMDKCTTSVEKNQVINAAGSVKTFLALVFVSKYLEQDELSSAAAQAVMKIALPASGEKNGLTGQVVREALQKAKEKISGNDSQYYKIDIQEYLDKMPAETGYMSIFNGKDLSEWQGLVKNPVERAKMSPKELAKEQAAANKRMTENWSVKNGAIVFNGKGDNLCTIKTYKDFDMIVDWRITKNGDSGIYLRGTPQVQIWDTARVDVGAQVGSGGLYNNTKNPSKPLVLADNAIGDWNTFRIRMVDQRVTVYLNGILVVDNVIMENYWNRNIPIFSEGPIELQAHGTDLAFRNIYVREINPDTSNLTEEEKAEGFVSLFNGRDLDLWVGNKTDYVPEDGVIAVRPTQGSHGNLYTAKEYSDFIFRFEFQLTPGANNGLGIHTPLEGDAAYLGKELQILDNEAPIYANLQLYQYHGSVYGIIPAKRGFLKPVGEWNSQEVIVKGDDIKVILNGEVIVNGNVKEATKNGTPDHKEHPGLERHTGHIGFLGHGSELKFRNIRIKEL
jgi:HEAT repeat protein